MIAYYLILPISLLLLSLSAFCQSDERKRLQPGPRFTKGYYTIGNHAEKLNVSAWPAPDTAVTPAIRKGYYSIGSNDTTHPKKNT